MKNLTRKFLLAVLAVVFAAVSLGTTTFAWFSTNNKVEVTGMQVKAVTEGNLVINKKHPVPKKSTQIAATFAGDSYLLRPMTYDDGWKIPDSNAVIDQFTGDKGSSGLEEIKSGSIIAAQPNGAKGYYVDYLIYIASAGEKLENQDLEVTLNVSSLSEMYVGALTIAFYAGTETSGDNFTVGIDEEIDATVQYKHFTKIESGATVKDDDAEAVVILTNIDIPSCEEQTAGIPILMRVYFDGELSSDINKDVYTIIPNPSSSGLAAGGYYICANSETQTYEEVASTASFNKDLTYYTKSTSVAKYINSANIPVNEITLTVSFVAEDHK